MKNINNQSYKKSGVPLDSGTSYQIPKNIPMN